MNRAALGVPLCGTGLPLFARMQGTLLRRYAGSSENFVLVKTGITAVLSFEFPVMSETRAGLTQDSTLTTPRAGARRIFQAARISRAAALDWLLLSGNRVER